MATVRKGRKGRVALDATNLEVISFSFTHEIPEVMANTTETGSAQTLDEEGGYERVTGQATVMMFEGTAESVYAGATGAFDLYVGSKTATPWEFNAFLTTVEFENDVSSDDAIGFTINFSSTGAITKGN